MSSARTRLALVAAIVAAAAGVATTGCGGDDEEPEATVSEETSESGDLGYEDPFATPNENKEDYKEILDNVQEAAEETSP